MTYNNKRLLELGVQGGCVLVAELFALSEEAYEAKATDRPSTDIPPTKTALSVVFMELQ
jgi:hypothetical protein